MSIQPPIFQNFEEVRQFSDDLEKRIKNDEVTFDLGGHYYSEDRWYDKRANFKNFAFDSRLFSPLYTRQDKQTGAISFAGSYSSRCNCCGEYVNFQVDGNVIRTAEKCAYPNGFPPYKIRISVPSGKLVVANDLRIFFQHVSEANNGEMDTDIGLMKWCQFFAEQANLGYIFTSNTSPDLFKTKKDTFALKCGSDAQKNLVASICTDLWACCVADYDTVEAGYEKYKNSTEFDRYDTLPGNFEDALKAENATVIRVTPGDYEIECFRYSHNGNRVQTLAKINRVK